MTEAKIPLTYVRPDNTAVLTCPHCGRQKTIQAETFKGAKHKLKVKCGCQNVFTVHLEFRKRVRKKTNLRGTYINNTQNTSGNVIIKNISVSGLEFTSYDANDFKVNDELTLNFNLDDEHLTEIRKDVIIRDVRRNSIGCEFDQDQNLAFDGPLGLYIMS